MFVNYLKTAFRSLLKSKITTFINLFGLAVGMTAAVFIFLWVQNEVTHDNFHPDKENIYRITNSIHVSKEDTWVWDNSPMLMAETATKEIPEVEKTARVIFNSWSAPVLNVNNKLFSEKTTAYVDKSWFSIFHYDFVEGNAAGFSSNPFTMILTTSKAKKYFGDGSPLGQVIRMDTINYVVKGVIKDNPANSSFQFDVIMNMEGRLANPVTLKNDKTWNNFGYVSFLKLRADAHISKVEVKLNDIINKNRTNHTDVVSLRSLQQMYFENDLQSSDMPHGNKSSTYIFSILGLLLLITACINYVNLTTAKASLRVKEISVRKIIGAQRSHLFYQFLTDSLIISFAALLCTLFLIKVCLPAFNEITEVHFVLPLDSAPMWRILAGTLLAATLLNGLYPAALLSSLQPLNVFRGKAFLKLGDGTIRKALVIFQFSLAMLLIIGTIVIYRQLHFMQTTNPGYNVSQVISMEVPYSVVRKFKGEQRKSFLESVNHELQSQSSIAGVSRAGAEIINIQSASSGNADWDGRDTAYNPTIARFSADTGFKKLFDLQLIAGHWFAAPVGKVTSYILNETAVAEFNMHRPIIGQRFIWGSDTGYVTGVVKDFYFKSMHEKIGPLVITDDYADDSYYFIKTSPGNIDRALSAAGSIWAKFVPDEPFSYKFLDDSFDTMYKTDIKASKLIFIFSIIAIIISALGLFGLATFTAEQRSKEISIRKVLGATVQQLATLLSADFVKLVLIAVVIASPLAWWIMTKWLQDFAYRINISLGIFLLAAFISLFIAIIAISFQAVKSALANPVRNLRSE